MKNIIRFTSLIALMSISQAVLTSEITDNYATGDTLTATTLNNIKAAVNDNDTRINSNTAEIIGKQNLVSGSCPPGSSIRVIAADGTVTCEEDTDTDTNTTYSAGTGLTLSRDSFSADTNFLQRRVADTCAAGSSISSIDAAGTVTCETDNDTTYTAGSGLTLSAGSFSADTGFLQRRVTGACAVGSAISSINADGTVTCEDAAPQTVRRSWNSNGVLTFFTESDWVVEADYDGVNVTMINRKTSGQSTDHRLHDGVNTVTGSSSTDGDSYSQVMSNLLGDVITIDAVSFTEANYYRCQRRAGNAVACTKVY